MVVQILLESNFQNKDSSDVKILYMLYNLP